MQIFRRFFIVLVGFLSLAAAPAYAAGKDPVLTSSAQAWVLVDGASGFVMSARDKDLALNPGELVHLMTIYTALEAVGTDKKALTAPVSIRAEDVARSEGSRRLYLVPGEPHPLRTMLQGIAVTGAEDAVLAVAAHVAGDEKAFAARMNETARKLALTDSVFSSPAVHKDNRMSAHDLARLTVAFVKAYPQAYRWFSQKEFHFTTHSLRSRNLLLWRGEGIGGVMSSTDTVSMAGSWHRDAEETRLPRDVVAVVLGGKSAELVTSDTQSLLQYGRLGFETLRLFPADTLVTKVDILMGNREKLEVGTARVIWVTVRRQDIVTRGLGGFAMRFEYLSPAVAPVKQGDVVGTLHVEFLNHPVEDFDLVAMHDVGPGSFLSRFVDSVRLRMKPAEERMQRAAPVTADGKSIEP